MITVHRKLKITIDIMNDLLVSKLTYLCNFLPHTVMNVWLGDVITGTDEIEDLLRKLKSQSLHTAYDAVHNYRNDNDPEDLKIRVGKNPITYQDEKFLAGEVYRDPSFLSGQNVLRVRASEILTRELSCWKYERDYPITVTINNGDCMFCGATVTTLIRVNKLSLTVQQFMENVMSALTPRHDIHFQDVIAKTECNVTLTDEYEETVDVRSVRRSKVRIMPAHEPRLDHELRSSVSS